MKSTRRAFVLLITAALAFAVIAGCKPGDEGLTWVYDFMADGDAFLSADPAWYVDTGSMGEYSHGYWLGDASVAAPYLFTGDFVAEFEFYLKVLSGESIFRYAFRLVDPNWDYASRRYFNFEVNDAAFPSIGATSYEIAQGNNPYVIDERDGNVPYIANGINTCRLVRTGNVITTYMNGELIDSETITAGNQPSIGYSPFVHGYNTDSEADSSFYIRKLTVTCLPGERVDHDW